MCCAVTMSASSGRQQRQPQPDQRGDRAEDVPARLGRRLVRRGQAVEVRRDAVRVPDERPRQQRTKVTPPSKHNERLLPSGL